MMHHSHLFAIIILTVVAAAPYQELVPRPGHIPVYIREGDTPLSEINPKLAEAFLEKEHSNQGDNAQLIPTASKIQKSDDRVFDLDREVPKAHIGQMEKTTESDIASFDVVKSEDTTEKS